MLRKYIALYKYYCKVAPAVWRSRGQQCTGECKYPFLSCGISVMLGSGRNRAFPGHMREGMRKPRERDPTPAMPLCTPRLLYPRIKSRISCLRFPLRPVNLWGTIKSGYMVSFFSRNPGTEFEIFGGVYSSKRCKSLWSATGPTCHTALCSTEIPGGRSGPSVLKKDLWERRKGSQCQISPFFFPPLWGIRPAPMTSDLISSDAFFSPASLHTSTHPSLLLWTSSRFQYQPEQNMHQFFSRTALNLQCF